MHHAIMLATRANLTHHRAHILCMKFHSRLQDNTLLQHGLYFPFRELDSFFNPDETFPIKDTEDNPGLKTNATWFLKIKVCLPPLQAF